MKSQIYLEGFIKLVTELYSYHGHQIQSTTRVDDYSVDLLIKSKRGEDYLTRCSIRTEVDGDSINSLILARLRRRYSKCAFISAGEFTETAKGIAKDNDVYILDGDNFQSQLQSARVSEKEKPLRNKMRPMNEEKSSLLPKVSLVLSVITFLYWMFANPCLISNLLLNFSFTQAWALNSLCLYIPIPFDTGGLIVSWIIAAPFIIVAFVVGVISYFDSKKEGRTKKDKTYSTIAIVLSVVTALLAVLGFYSIMVALGSAIRAIG